MSGRVVVARTLDTVSVLRDAAPRVLTVSRPATPTIVVRSPAQGPPGRPGRDAIPNVYTLTNVSSWAQQHAFAWLPLVRLIDPGGAAVDAGVEYPDPHTVYIEFPTPFTGTIYLS